MAYPLLFSQSEKNGHDPGGVVEHEDRFVLSIQRRILACQRKQLIDSHVDRCYNNIHDTAKARLFSEQQLIHVGGCE